MSPRSSRGGCAAARTLASAARRRAEARRVVRPLAGQQPARRIVGERVDRGQVEADPGGDGRQAQLGQAVQPVAGPCTRGRRRRLGAGVHVAVPVGGPVGVGVVVEEQVQPGRGAEVEQRERLCPAVQATRRGRGPAAARCSARPRWSGSSGWRRAARSSLAVQPAEVGEVAAPRPRRARRGLLAHARHGVVVRGQRVLAPDEEQEVHRGQQEVWAGAGAGGPRRGGTAARRRRPRPGRWPGRWCRRRARRPWRSRGSGRAAARSTNTGLRSWRGGAG